MIGFFVTSREWMILEKTRCKIAVPTFLASRGARGWSAADIMRSSRFQPAPSALHTSIHSCSVIRTYREPVDLLFTGSGDIDSVAACAKPTAMAALITTTLLVALAMTTNAAFNVRTFKYTTVTGYFLQDKPDTDPRTFQYVCSVDDDNQANLT